MLYPCFHFDINIETTNLCEIKAKTQQLTQVCPITHMPSLVQRVTQMTTRMWCRCAADDDKADTRPTSTRTTADKYKDDAGQLHFN